MLGTSKSVWGFDPRSVPGCQVWFDAADTSTITFSSGSNVNQWSDKSGNGRNATVYNGTPTYTVSSGMTFNGSSTLQVSYPASPAVETLFVIIKFNSVSSQGDIFAGTSTGQREFLMYSPYSPGTMYLGRYGSAPSGSINGGTVTTGTTYMLEYIFNGTGNTISFYQSGTVTSSGTPQFTYGAGGTITLIGSYGGGGFLQGQIYEILVYNSALTTSERQQVEGYLAHKWGLSLSIPSTHPFYSIRPHLRTFQPTDVPGCQLWLDGAYQSSLVLSGSNVTAWTDKSPLATSFTLSNGSGGSTIRTTYAGLPVVQVSNSCFFNASYSYPLATRSIFFVMAEIVHSDWRGLLSFADTAGQSDYNTRNGYVITSTNTVGSNVQFSQNYGNGGFNFNYNASNGSKDVPFQLYEDVTSNTAVTLFVTGSNVYSSNTSVAPLTSTGLTVGGRGGIPNSGALVIAEVLLYSNALTTSQRQQVEGYLAHKWGLTTPIPSTHPFKSIMPATSAHFYPTSITGCQLWLDGADSTAITIGTGVSQWNDKSGNSNNLTQSTTGSQPTYASSLITFENNKYLNIPATVLNNLSTWSLFFVINPISASNWIMSKQKDGIDSYNVLSITYYNYATGSLESGPVASIYWRSFNAGSQLVSSEPLTTSTLHFCSLTYDGTNLYFYMNGQLNQITSGTFAIQNETSPNTYTLGALIYPGGDIKNSGVTNFRLGEMITYNTFLTNSQREQIEGYLAHKWGLTSSLSSFHPYKPLPPIFPPTVQYTVTAIGGTIVSTVGTTYHVFRNTGSFVLRRALTVNYLVVGGGGGGGDRHGGGGGAGGVLSGSWSASSGTYTVAVGSGGQYGATSEGGQVAYGYPNGSGSKGGNSVLSGTGISVTANGGGGGGSYDGNPSGTFGSGGGGGGQNLSGIAGTAGQGNAGGSGLLPGGGGGGGAGGAGVAANTGTGGIGTTSFSSHLLAVGYGTTFAVPTSPNTVISGGVAYIAGGGGGCAGTSPGPGGSGGLGGGGRGDWADANITAGTPNTGGGGGGTRSHPDSLQTTGRNGGSGLVLLWY